MVAIGTPTGSVSFPARNFLHMYPCLFGHIVFFCPVALFWARRFKSSASILGYLGRLSVVCDSLAVSLSVIRSAVFQVCLLRPEGG